MSGFKIVLVSGTIRSSGRSYDPSGTGCPAFFAHVFLRRNELPTRRGFTLREIAHDRLDLIEGTL